MGLLRRGSALAVVLSLWLGCGGPSTYPGHGVVHEVSRPDRQALIAHEAIPGLMPGMTMNFTVDDAEALASLKSGDVIDFELTSQGGRFSIDAVVVVGRVERREGWSRMGDGLVKSDPAPGFELTRTSGERVSLAGLAGQAVLLDFIFTRCSGPCPTLTSTKVAVQRELPVATRARTHFVSISIDPARDTPEDLRVYGEARGADLADWSFLTGDEARVQAVVAAYGVGTTWTPDGELEHILATFLIDPNGRIVKRYIGLEHEPKTIVADVEAVVFPES